MARLYADEDFPGPVVRALPLLGHDVRTAHEAGLANARVPDAEVVAFAATDGRAVLTLNRKHFIRLHHTGTPHAGIVVCTFVADHLGQAGRITAALDRVPSLAGLLIRVNRQPRRGRAGIPNHAMPSGVVNRVLPDGVCRSQINRQLAEADVKFDSG